MTQNRKPRLKHTSSPSPSSETQQTPSQYAHAITKIAVTQIIQTVGFTSAQSSALDSLTRITTLYLQTLATYASSTAAVTGNRTQSNLFDIVFALEDLALITGAAVSTTLKDIRKFVCSIDETPFSRGIPRNGGVSGLVVFPSMVENSVVKMGPDVPTWLPPFPCFEPGPETKHVSKREVWWEEGGGMCEGLTSVASGGAMEKGGCWRGDKVKFRIGVRKGKMGMSDLELRDGGCRGGKRVCLVKRLDSGVFDDDEDRNVDVGNGKDG